MLRIYIICTKIIFCNWLFCLSIPKDSTCPIELFIYLTNVVSEDIVTISLEPLGPVWDHDHLLILSGYEQIDIAENENVDGPTMGCDFIGSTGGQTCVVPLHSESGYGIFPFGYFKVTSTRHENYFYLDTRDDDYPYLDNGFGQNDASKKDTGIGFYRCACAPNNTNDIDTPILPFEELGIWDIWEKDQNPQIPSRVKFQPTTPTNLMIGDTDIHPLLTWNFSEPDAAQYEVWRKDEVNKFSIWYKIAENLTSTTFTDTEVYLDEVGILFSYKIIAVSGDGSKYSPDYSNVESVVG